MNVSQTRFKVLQIRPKRRTKRVKALDVSDAINCQATCELRDGDYAPATRAKTRVIRNQDHVKDHLSIETNGRRGRRKRPRFDDWDTSEDAEISYLESKLFKGRDSLSSRRKLHADWIANDGVDSRLISLLDVLSQRPGIRSSDIESGKNKFRAKGAFGTHSGESVAERNEEINHVDSEIKSKSTSDPQKRNAKSAPALETGSAGNHRPRVASTQVQRAEKFARSIANRISEATVSTLLRTLQSEYFSLFEKDAKALDNLSTLSKTFAGSVIIGAIVNVNSTTALVAANTAFVCAAGAVTSPLIPIYFLVGVVQHINSALEELLRSLNDHEFRGEVGENWHEYQCGKKKSTVRHAVTAIALMYDFGFIHQHVVYTLIRRIFRPLPVTGQLHQQCKSREEWFELQMDLSMQMLRHVGIKMRSQCHEDFSNMVAFLASQVAGFKKNCAPSERLSFLINDLEALQRPTVTAPVAVSHFNYLRNWLRLEPMLADHVGGQLSELHVIRFDNGAIAGIDWCEVWDKIVREEVTPISGALLRYNQLHVPEISQTLQARQKNRLLHAAEKLHLHSPLLKAAYIALMGGADTDDAVSRLLEVVRGKKARIAPIVALIQFLSCNAPKFNTFFPVVQAKLASLPSFIGSEFSFQLRRGIHAQVTAMNNFSQAKTELFARYVAELITCGSNPVKLSCIRQLPISPSSNDFLRSVLKRTCGRLHLYSRKAATHFCSVQARVCSKDDLFSARVRHVLGDIIKESPTTELSLLHEAFSRPESIPLDDRTTE